MQVKSLVKGIMVALPVLALTACGTTPDDATTNENSTANNPNAAVVATAVETVKTPEELRIERYTELRKRHILFFDFDKSTIKGEFTELLSAHADYLVKNPGVKVKIEGHADELGTPEYNIALGERRAKAVSKYLVSLGVTPAQITTVSYGEEMPLELAHNEAAWAKNRRAVLVY